MPRRKASPICKSTLPVFVARCPRAVKHKSLPIYALQFHPEVTHTPLGSHMLHNFLTAVCGCSGAWKLGDFAKMATDHLSVTDQTFQELARFFTDEEQMDLCFQVATFVGYGRMGSALAMIDDLREEYSEADAVLAPWRQTPQSVV